MKDAEYYRKLDIFLEEVMKQAGSLVFQDYGLMNDVLMESTRRLKEAEQDDGQ